jgi:hypothetical protein
MTGRAERRGVSPPERRVPSLTFLLTIGNIVVNVAKSHTYDIQLEMNRARAGFRSLADCF